MVNLREKYGREIALMKADAQRNEEEATENVEACAQEVVEYKEELRNLKETAKTAHKAFLEVVKNIGKLAFTKDPNSEEVLEATKPCDIYVQAAGQKPIMEEKLVQAKEELIKAQQEMYEASEAVNCIGFFE